MAERPTFTQVHRGSTPDDFARAHRDIYEWAVRLSVEVDALRRTVADLIDNGGGGGGGGGGAVDSVNGQTGVVQLNAVDIPYTPSGGVTSNNVQNAITELDGDKANTVHTHAQTDVTGLSTTLAGKSDVGHTHAQADVTGLSTTLAGKADTLHVHPQQDVMGLTSALNNKQNTSVMGTSLAALSDPNVDRIVFWDDSAGALQWLTPGTALEINGTTLRYAFPAVSLQRVAAQSIPDNTLTNVAFDTEVYDPLNMHTGTNNFFTVPAGAGGLWLVCAGVQYVAAMSGYRAGVVQIGNNAGAEGNANWQFGPANATVNTGNNGITWARLCHLAAGATVGLATQQTTGSAIDTAPDTFLTGILLLPL